LNTGAGVHRLKGPLKGKISRQKISSSSSCKLLYI
jgi:hypothetical protein